MTEPSNYDRLMTVHELIDALYDNVPNRHSKVAVKVFDPDGAHHLLRCRITDVHDDTWKMPLVEIVCEPLPGKTPIPTDVSVRIKFAAERLLDELDGVTGNPHDDPGARDAMSELCDAVNAHPAGGLE